VGGDRLKVSEDAIVLVKAAVAAAGADVTVPWHEPSCDAGQVLVSEWIASAEAWTLWALNGAERTLSALSIDFKSISASFDLVEYELARSVQTTG